MNKMVSNKKAQIGWIVAIAVIVILVVIAVYYFSMSGGNNQSTPTGSTNPASSPTPPSSTNSGQTQPTSKTYNVGIQNLAFSPQSLAINAGDTVIWTNKDSVSHTITSDSGTELNSGIISNGETYSHTFNTAGTFNYHCSIHTSMKAKIIVQ